MLNLYQLNNNESAVIKVMSINEHAKLRLSEMRVMVGTTIRMIKKTPFGGPVQIKVNNYYLAIRKEDAVNIMVKVND